MKEKSHTIFWYIFPLRFSFKLMVSIFPQITWKQELLYPAFLNSILWNLLKEPHTLSFQGLHSWIKLCETFLFLLNLMLFLQQLLKSNTMLLPRGKFPFSIFYHKDLKVIFKIIYQASFSIFRKYWWLTKGMNSSYTLFNSIQK